MSQLLEAIMLICFGLSWPMALVKNIKAKSAEGMSLSFLLLIITGYVAGTAAKIIAGNITYVLIVYVVNLVIVTMNLIVFFYNRSLDKKNSML
jgi:hypothetical protein